MRTMLTMPPSSLVLLNSPAGPRMISTRSNAANDGTVPKMLAMGAGRPSILNSLYS
ncbi:hypothetical protein D9M71_703920 [compost metagenome]